MSVPVVYVGWRDLGPKRRGRVWQAYWSTDPRRLTRPPFCYIGHVTRWKP